MFDLIRRHFTKLRLSALHLLTAVAVGTVFAFLISAFHYILGSFGNRILAYLKLRLPSNAVLEVGVMLLTFLLIAVLTNLPRRVLRSLGLGLIPFDWVWVPAVTIAWLAYEENNTRIAWASIASAALVTVVARWIGSSSAGDVGSASSGFLEPDLPVAEDGEDLLGRGELVQSVVSAILLETPAIIAVTGRYGDGKTSFLNLTVGELRKSEEIKAPIIVRFSPWMAGDSNALVLSLLNSIVAEIKHKLVVPGLGGDATRYARTLLSAVPRMERLKDLLAEPSQEERIDALVNRIRSVRRRLLVVLDDLDRMEAKELETVLKVLRGSDKLANITFLCAFDKTEVGKILKVTRPDQETPTFIEKFFPLEFRLPEIDSAQLQTLFSQRISRILERNALPQAKLSKSLEKLWQGGVGGYFQNLRRIKLFFNRVSRSLDLIADEVNIEDFIKLEVIRDTAPTVYELIYRHPEHFWNRNYAFEVRFKGSEPLDEDKAKKWHAEFYNSDVEASVPAQRRYVFQLLEDLFPQFAQSRGKSIPQDIGPVEAERERRIFHPRCFPQYFTLKTPSELFPQKEFDAFLSSVRKMGADEAAATFNKKVLSLAKEDFKRWHFMHLIENDFTTFSLDAQRGLCRGMAQNSAHWQADAFELLIAISCTRETLTKITDSSGRKELLRSIVGESASDLYTLILIRRIEHSLKDPSALADDERYRTVGFGSGKAGSSPNLLSDIQEIKGFTAEHLRVRYLGHDAPSVFEQYGSLGSGVNRIEPNLFLFNWQYLSADAQSDEKNYLRGLFAKRPQDLNEFLKLMFRVPFIDDYAELRPLIDYKELSELITLHESVLDRDKVEQFRHRQRAEEASTDATED